MADPSSLDITNPMAQAFLQEGTARGYTPLQIAAVLGNSQQENNLNSGGAPGDGGISHGAMQWNAERWAGLQNFAKSNKTSWDDPGIQAKYYFNELDGPEKQWGDRLKSANDPISANNAVISSLRPEGWKASDPTQGNAYENRLQGTMLAAKALNNMNSADTPQGSPMSSQGQPNSSGFAIPGQGQDQGSFFDKFKQGGLGSALGFSNEQQYQPWSMGGALTKMAIAAMARDNPQGAAAMAQIPSMEARSYQRPMSMAGYNQASGKAVIFNSRTGGFNQVQAGTPFYQAPEGQVKDFDETNQHINTADNSMSQLKNVRDMVMNGQLDPSILARGQSYLNGLSGSSNPNDLAIYNAVHNISIAHDQLLKQHSGTQTDADSENAFKTIMPGNSEYDKGAFVQAINNILRAEGATMTSNIQSQNRRLGVYGNQLTNGDNSYADRYATTGAKWNDIVTKDIPQSNAWAEKNAQSNADTAAAPAAPPVKFTSGTSGSTTSGGSIHEGRTAQGPDGPMVIRGGKWVKQ